MEKKIKVRQAQLGAYSLSKKIGNAIIAPPRHLCSCETAGIVVVGAGEAGHVIIDTADIDNNGPRLSGPGDGCGGSES